MKNGGISFGEWLAEVRYTKKLSLRDIRNKFGVDKSTWNRWENGTYPFPDQIQLIATILQIPENEIRGRLIAEGHDLDARRPRSFRTQTDQTTAINAEDMKFLCQIQSQLTHWMSPSEAARLLYLRRK